MPQTLVKVSRCNLYAVALIEAKVGVVHVNRVPDRFCSMLSRAEPEPEKR